MKRIEMLELAGHRHEIIAGVKGRADKYHAMLEWDLPELDESAADGLILVEMRKALDDFDNEYLG